MDQNLHPYAPLSKPVVEYAVRSVLLRLAKYLGLSKDFPCAWYANLFIQGHCPGEMLGIESTIINANILQEIRDRPRILNCHHGSLTNVGNRRMGRIAQKYCARPSLGQFDPFGDGVASAQAYPDVFINTDGNL